MAFKLLSERLNATGPAARADQDPSRPLNREFTTSFTVVVLVVVTATAAIFAGYNFSKEHSSLVPYDGVTWDESRGHLVANRVEAQSPAEHAGIKVGDELVAVEKQETPGLPALMRQMYHKGVWAKATYSLVRGGIPLDTVV